MLRLIALLSGGIEDLEWRAKDAEFSPSPGVERIERAWNAERALNTAALLSALAFDPQLIDGQIIGRAEDDDVRIVAVRGDEWDVYTNREGVVQIIDEAIPERSEIPG